MPWLLIFIGFILLFLGGEFLVKGAVQLALIMRVSTLVIGATVVSFATSAPELLVSLNAAYRGHPDISLGNVVGSNIANLGLVLGLTTVIYEIGISKESRLLHWPFMMLMTILMMLSLQLGTSIDPWEGMIAFGLLVIFPVVLIRNSRSKKVKLSEDRAQELRAKTLKSLIFLVLGAVSLYFGSEWLVSGAAQLASAWGVSDRLISVSVVAIGTSLPELAASLIAAMRKEKALSLGNLLGSNIFNIGAVLGLTAMVMPIEMQDLGLRSDLWWMFGIALILLPLMYLPPRILISRWKGFLLLTVYIGYIISLF
jgi:cation:H+ antiporter